MTLHPQARAALAGPPGDAFTLEDPAPARKSMMDGALAECGPGPAVDLVADVTAHGVPCRLYRSGGAWSGGAWSGGDRSGAPGPAAIVYAHGGGWALGGLDTHDALCRELAVRSGLPVLAVDYRLAPEHPYPAAVEDVEAAAAWLRGPDADEYGVRAGRLVVAGDSAGGHLAAVVARRGRDNGAPYRGQVLVYPVIDPAQRYEGGTEYGLGAGDMRLFWDAYAPPGVDRRDPDLDPLGADLAGLPPALVVTAEYDVLRDEGERYAAALAEAGVPAVGVRYVGMVHGFVRKLATFDTAASAVAQIAAAAVAMVA
jgi:acetyl esterase